MNKLPFGRSKLASWATALFLIKEETGMSEEAIIKVLDQVDVNFDDTLEESTWYMTKNNALHPGVYTLQYDVASPKTGETIAQKNQKIVVHEGCIPIGQSIGANIYEVTHIKTKQKIYINAGEIKR
jgi:flagella basal body P-ring formation protein FlgA